MTIASAAARRRREHAALLEAARQFVGSLDPALAVRAAVVVGSVARGDFHSGSDIDVLVVADRLPRQPLERLVALDAPLGIEVIAWSPQDWARATKTHNPLWAEALAQGVWLAGSPQVLASPSAALPGLAATDVPNQHG